MFKWARTAVELNWFSVRGRAKQGVDVFTLLLYHNFPLLFSFTFLNEFHKKPSNTCKFH